MLFKNKKRGYSLIEILVAMAIGLLFLGVVIFFYAERRQAVSLNLALEQVATVIHDARNKSLSSLEESDHGVYFATDAVTLFRGSTYDPDAATNEIFVLPNGTEISDWDIVGGQPLILFVRPRGFTTNVATVTIGLISDPAASSTLTINALGAVDRHD